ncbi:MAG: NYN domain-containing protein [Microcoleaceae cyanobacterium MO_207.B10]|nr:NYN domain-containing protein [Microcoleaceae cyanobacterium MO_207.B10]
MNNKVHSPLVSLYWDYQNVHVNRFNPFLARYCQTFAHLHGDLIRQRVYAYWRQEKLACEQRLHELNFDCIDVPKTEKQSVDQKLIADCERELYSTLSADILILITGDGDYINIVRQWKAKGKKVIIFANSKNAKQKLVNLADEYYFVDKKLPELFEVKTKIMQLA